MVSSRRVFYRLLLLLLHCLHKSEDQQVKRIVAKVKWQNNQSQVKSSKKRKNEQQSLKALTCRGQVTSALQATAAATHVC